jgi:hypothetical protein
MHAAPHDASRYTAHQLQLRQPHTLSLICFLLPQPGPVQPEPPPRGKVGYGLFLAWRHAGAWAEINRNCGRMSMSPSLVITSHRAIWQQALEPQRCGL